MKFSLPTLLALTVCTHAIATESLPVVSVTADFREAKSGEISSSLTVVDQQRIASRNAQHLEQVLNLAPNVNFSSGASRARFYQIRGIGERSQFVEPINPSVGILIDDIDYSGIGAAGTLLDVRQIEILRGPQGTRYGANALAGLINLKTNDPSDVQTATIKSSVASYNSYSVSAIASGPLSEKILYRIAADKSLSDGYIENDYLNRKDTNDIDEETLRAKLRWITSDELSFDITATHIDIDNGYDAFSLDNNRHTLSDEPGHDRQETTALGLKATWDGSSIYTTEILTSASFSDTEYGYDEDWSYASICDGQACDGWAYSSFDNYSRERDNKTIEIRLLSKPDARIFNDTSKWILGVYSHSQDEDLVRQYTYLASDFTSDYSTRRVSAYAELETSLTEQLVLTSGYRLERNSIDYRDSDNIDFSRDSKLWGGKLALEYLLNSDVMIYALVSRGYKAGGVNSKPELTADLLDYEAETMLNYETGLKASLWNDRLRTQIAIFFQDRKDIQVKQSLVRPIAGTSCPCQFIDYNDNAAEGDNYGLEAELQWQANDNWLLSGSFGLLETEFKNFVNADGVDMEGREQAHAPTYQFNLSAVYRWSDSWHLRLEVEGKDEFYFSDRHEEQSSAFEVWNLNLGYDQKNWQVALWGRNLLDEEYQVRGFGSFGNDPRKFYVTEPYYQWGEPRVFGVNGSYTF